jgi:hypothetical protein
VSDGHGAKADTKSQDACRAERLRVRGNRSVSVLGEKENDISNRKLGGRIVT